MTSAPEPLEQDFEFTLTLVGLPDLAEGDAFDDVAEKLFAAGCDDGTFGVSGGRATIDFARRAASLQDAVLSAIHDVQRAGVGARVTQVDECNLVTQAEIARRMGISRQAVGQLIARCRGPGGFPPPVCHVREATPLWAWCDVAYWLRDTNRIRPEQLHASETIATLNLLLDLERQKERNPLLVESLARGLAEV